MKKLLIISLVLFFCIFCEFFASSAFSEEIIFQEITVKDGQTLWSIANEYLQDPQRWPEILKHNQMPTADPNVVLPGMKLKVPVLLIKEHLRAAYLVHLLNRVDYRRKNEISWRKAALNLELYQDDGVRTLPNSQAEIKFPTGERVNLRENSLIILRPEEKREEITLLSGELRASRAKVLTANTLIEPKISPTGVNPEFRTKIKEDKTTLVAVYKGEVDVTAQGKTVTVPAGFGSEIKLAAAPTLPIPLPSLEVQAKLKTPQAENFTLQKFNLEITSEEKGKIRTEQYHLQISPDKEFKHLLIDETGKLEEKIDLKRNLADGEYFWRLAWVDEKGLESEFSPAQNFVMDTQAPKLELFSPQEKEKVSGEFVFFQGKTEKGTMVYLEEPARRSPGEGERIVSVDEEGNFTISIFYPAGEYKVNLRAEDRAGNVNMLTREFVRITAEEKLPGERKKIHFTPGTIALGIFSFSVIIYVLVVLLR